LHEVITFLVSMQISISSLQTHNVNRCGRSRHLARKLSLRRKRSSPNVFEMAATETITSIILIKLIRVSLGTVRSEERFSRNAETDLVCRLLLQKKKICSPHPFSFLNDTASTDIYTLSLHDALPISCRPIMSIDVVEVVIWRESSVSGGSGAVQMFLRWQQRKP